jgi:hypothetical protein
MNTNDFQVGLDPTGFSSITGAQLAQLVNSDTPSSDRGMILITTDQTGVPVIPAAGTTVEWQRFLWLRLSPLASSFTVCAWNPSQTFNMGYSDGSGTTVSTNWNPVSSGSIPAGSIQGFQLAAATITKDKIVSVDLSQINGSTALITTATTPTLADTTSTSSFATGFVIAPLAITTGKIANSGVTNSNIAPVAVTFDKIGSDSIAKDMLRAKADGTTEWFSPTDIVKSAIPVVAGNSLKLPQVNAGATDFQMVAPTTLGRILQQVTLQTILATDSGSIHCALTATPTQTTGPTSTVLASLTAAAFTPLNANSTIIVEAYLQLASSNGSAQIIGALFQDAIDAAVAASAVQVYNATNLVPAFIRFSIASWGTGSSKVFKVGISSVTANAYLNSTDGSTIMFGGLGTPSWIKITEYL